MRLGTTNQSSWGLLPPTQRASQIVRVDNLAHAWRGTDGGLRHEEEGTDRFADIIQCNEKVVDRSHLHPILGHALLHLCVPR